MSPVETNTVLPSAAACRVIWLSVASLLLPSPTPTGSCAAAGLSKTVPASGLTVGMVSHSP